MLLSCECHCSRLDVILAREVPLNEGKVGILIELN